jgi:uncharacterized protein YoxC
MNGMLIWLIVLILAFAAAPIVSIARRRAIRKQYKIIEKALDTYRRDMKEIESRVKRILEKFPEKKSS